MIKKCKECNQDFEVKENEEWKNLCKACYTKLKQKDEKEIKEATKEANKQYHIEPINTDFEPVIPSKDNIRTQIWRGQSFKGGE